MGILIILIGASIIPIISGNIEKFNLLTEIFIKENKDNLISDFTLKPKIFLDHPVEVWSKTFGGNGDDETFSVHQTNDGGYILTGYETSSFSLNIDVWLIKTDANGDAPTKTSSILKFGIFELFSNLFNNLKSLITYKQSKDFYSYLKPVIRI